MKKYGMLLEKIASSAKESNEINISGIELTDEDKKLVKHFLKDLQSHEDKVNIIKEISNVLLSQSSKTVEWNQKIYDTISSYANKNELYKEIPQELRIDINKAVDKNVSETIFSYTKYFEAYNMVWHLLINNKEQIDSMLLNYYEVGCCVTVKKEFCTYIILLKMNKHKAIIDGVNPVTGAKEPLTMEEKFIANLEYKDKVIEGNYFYSGDSILNVVFKLWNGETKEENIVI